jgi:hypothetical protein
MSTKGNELAQVKEMILKHHQDTSINQGLSSGVPASGRRRRRIVI